MEKDLRCFDGEAITKTGEYYSKSVLILIIAAIYRHLTGLPYYRLLGILRDREFML